VEQFAYFMIRVRREPTGAPGGRLAGIVERLASGEKRSFDTGAELLDVVTGWAEPPPNMQPHPSSDNR